MIDDLRAMAIFVRVAETGSFRGAANLLGLSPSVVSHHVGALEQRLDTALLYRSTRKVTLTQDGETLLASAKRMIEAAQIGLAHFVDVADVPVGNLKLSLPAVLTSHPIMDHLGDFARAHPAIALTLSFSDIRENIIQSGLDLAIRMGRTEKSALSRRLLATEPRLLVASADYVRTRGLPRQPAALDDWDFIHFTPRLDALKLTNKRGKAATLGGKVRLSVDSSDAMRRLALAGIGFAALPAALVRADIDAGKLVHLLPQWSLPSLEIQAEWPNNSPRSGLTMRLVDYLTEKLRNAS